MRAPRRKTIAGALFAALFLAAIALAGNNLSGTSTQSALYGSHLSGPASQFASSTGPAKVTPATPAKGVNPQGITVGRSYKNAISPSVRSLGRAHGTGQVRVRPELPPLFTNKPLRQANDPVVQGTMPDPNMPSPILNFEGIDYPGVVCFCAPPDTNGEVGLTQYVQIVNEGFQVFDKTTGVAQAPAVAISSLWTGFGGLCEFNGFGDPVVVYDQLANRWVITQFAGNFPSTPITDQCIAVSTGSDALGTYAVYGFHMTDDFYDYPKFGVWPDAYYASANIFNASGTAFLGPQAYAFDRDAMLAGTPATFIAAPRGGSGDDSYMPADLDGLVGPPAGAPNPYVSIGVLPTWPVHRFHVDFDNPGASTFDLVGTLTPAPFTVLFSLVPQLGTGDGLDSLADRGMFRNAYRNFGDHEALTGNITVSSGGVAGVRWFEVDNVTSGTPSFTQQGTYQPDSTWRWMGSVAMDGNSNLAVGFSASSSAIFPQIRYAGRLAGDPAGDLTQGEAHLFDGTGSQTDTVSRWGDYSDMTVDPIDDCTFWYTQEYYETTSSFNWRTRIGNFKFPTCTAAPTGTLTGLVTDSSNGNPIAGAHINVAPLGASTTSGPDGHYSIILPTGTYDVTASAFGFADQTATGLVITDGGTTTHDFPLVAAPSHTVSGHVRDTDGNPLANATVTILGTPIPPATTGADGSYSIANVPEGEYDVRAEAGRCNSAQTQHLVVDSDETLDFSLPQRHDNFGYFCQVVTPSYIEGDTALSLTGDDNSIQVNLPFAFNFYGQTYNAAYVCTNGHLTFQATVGFCPFFNSSIPSAGTPNAAIYPFWDDLFLDGSSTAWTKLIGVAPNRQFVIEWRNARFFGDLTRRLDVEVVLYENGRILTQYRNIAADSREQGNSATIGIENAAGNDALQYSFNEATIGTPDFAVLYRLPPNGFVEGHVTDANDNLAISGATVKALQNGSVVRQTTTDANGFYRMQLFVGDYTIEASKTNYVTGSANVSIVEDQTITQDFSLATARAEVDPTSLEFIVPADQTRTKTLRLSNTGSADMTWEVRESGGGTASGHLSWLRRAPESGVQMRKNATGSGLAHPSAARWIPDKSSTPDPSILVYTDDAYHTSPNTYVDQALARLGLSYTAFYDGNFPGFEAALTGGGPWDVVVFADDNFFPPGSTLTALNNYVTGGGKLVVDSWTVAANPSPLWTTVGFQFSASDFDPPDPVHWWQPDHPVFTDPESVHEFTVLQSGRYGTYGQQGDPLANFEALAGSTVAPAAGQAKMVLGNDNHTIFKGFMDGQNDADRDADGVRDGVELWENMISGIEQGFFADVPWLSETPTSGTLTPGAHQDVQVTVDTTGLATGVYDARLTFRTNSGRQPNVVVPVRLIVPAYQQAFNSGGGAYTSVSGDPWSADRAYTPANGSGYVQSPPRTASTRSAIGGTLDDPLYQDARISAMSYRFTGLPPGVYQVELNFAEIQNKNPGMRVFDVTVNGVPYVTGLDISSRVGKNYALDMSQFVTPVGGEINVQFITRRSFGEPILNAVRVTHRPDQ
jgi:Malectin domain/Carboxypeptidase regulatory-like domain/Viral BACON domain